MNKEYTILNILSKKFSIGNVKIYFLSNFSKRTQTRINLMQKDDNGICLQKYEIMYYVCLARLLDCVSYVHNQQNEFFKLETVKISSIGNRMKKTPDAQPIFYLSLTITSVVK